MIVMAKSFGLVNSSTTYRSPSIRDKPPPDLGKSGNTGIVRFSNRSSADLKTLTEIPQKSNVSQTRAASEMLNPVLGALPAIPRHYQSEKPALSL